MKIKNAFLLCAALFALAVSVAACKENPDDGRPSMNSDTWLGKWSGPEGTSLEIAKEKMHYKLTITNLDGPKDYRGKASRGGIDFMRDGEKLTIHPGSGADTGMKWLADKHNCLVVAPNEGYCRD